MSLDELDTSVGKSLSVLINKNRFIVLEDVVGMAATAIGIARKDLADSIRCLQVQSNPEGYLGKILHVLRLPEGVALSGMAEMVKTMKAMDRIPKTNLVKPDVLAYKTENAAITALMIHVLFNSRIASGHSWCFKYVMRAPELAILVPVTKNRKTLKAVATLFCMPSESDSATTRVMARYLSEDTMLATPPFEVALKKYGWLNGSLKPT